MFKFLFLYQITLGKLLGPKKFEEKKFINKFRKKLKQYLFIFFVCDNTTHTCGVSLAWLYDVLTQGKLVQGYPNPDTPAKV